MAEYTIVLRNETNQEGGETKSTASNQQNGKEKKRETNQDKPVWKKHGDKIVASVNLAKKYIGLSLSNSINTVSLRTGQNELQERQQFVFENVMYGIDLMQGIVTGLVLSGGNPIGAVLGAVESVASTAIQISQKQRVIELNRAVENVSVGMANIRAGTSGNR